MAEKKRKNRSPKTGAKGLSPKNDFLAAVYDAIPDVILTTSHSGTIESCNKSIESVFGYRAQEIVGTQLCDLFSPPHKEGIKARIDLSSACGKSDGIDVIRRVEAIRKDGSIFPVSLSAAPLAYDGATYFTHSIRDITTILDAETELEKVTRELARSNSELQQFAAIASHDLQAPLRTVLAFAGYLSTEAGEQFSPEARIRLERIIKATERMQSLISNLLNLSRVNGEKRTVEMVSANTIFDEAVSDLGALINEAQAELTRDDLPEVCCEKSLIRQLFQNLIGNALKFRNSAVSPAVHVSCEILDSQKIFRVKDNGIGIDPKNHQKIFEAFQRLHSASEYPGTGLGLAICKKIIDRHGGTITVDSQKNQGACFSFSLGNLAPRAII